MSAGAVPPKRKLPDTSYAWRLLVAARRPAIVSSVKIRYAECAKGDGLHIPIEGIRSAAIRVRRGDAVAYGHHAPLPVNIKA